MVIVTENKTLTLEDRKKRIFFSIKFSPID